MRWKLITTFLLLSLLFMEASAITIKPETKYFIESSSGNEKVLFNVSINGNEVCLIPNFEGEKILTIPYYDSEKDKWSSVDSSFIQPNIIKFTALSLDKEELNTTTKDIGKVNGKFCQILNNKYRYYKFGNNSIIIASESTYSADAYTNITQETGYVHLNFTLNGVFNTTNMLFYSPFDWNSTNYQDNWVGDTHDLNADQEINFTTTPYGFGYEFTETMKQAFNMSNSDTFEINTSTLSIVTWTYPNGNGSLRRATSKYGSTSATQSYLMTHDSRATTRRASFQVSTQNNTVLNAQHTSTTGSPLNQWIMMTGTWNGTRVEYWQNESLGASVNASLSDADGRIKKTSQQTIVSGATANFWNGTIDNLIMINMTLNETHIRQLFNNQSEIFRPSGEMKFYNINMSENVNMTNVTIAACQTLHQSLIQMYISHGANQGAVVNLSNCNYNNYYLPNGDSLYMNITFVLLPNQTTMFYSPILGGDITFDTWLNESTGGGADTEYPIFSNYIEQPTDPATYSPSASYYFNTTITKTNGTSGIEFNGTNYSMSNISTVFNKTLIDLGAGNYSYYYWAYGNGSSTNYNKTLMLSYNISQENSNVIGLLNGFGGDLSIEYPQQFNATGYMAGGNLSIYRDGTWINNSVNFTLGSATYLIEFNVTGDQNYTSSNISFVLTIYKGNLSLSLDFNPSQSINNNTQSTVTGSGCIDPVNCTLVRNNAPVQNPDIQNLTEGTYTYYYNTSGNQNYSLATTNGDLTVTNYTAPIPSNATTVSATICRYKKLGYYNLKLPWIRQEGCI